MQQLDIYNILRATGGTLLSRNVESFSRVSTDSRSIKEGDLFVCLKGDRFNGHDFINDVIKLGAGGILADENRWPRLPGGELPEVTIFKVEDALTALGDIAAFWRQVNSFQVIAVTGSSGKTTTKDMIAGILSRNFAVTKTQGNFNNLIGLPLSLLAARPADEIVVLEMGMNRFGEIRRLAEIAHPDIGLITNVEAAHLEGVKTIEGVARAKGELFESLDHDDLAVVNLDDPHIASLASRCQARQVTFGLNSGADITAGKIRIDSGGKANFLLTVSDSSVEISLKVPGRHNMVNALAASAVAAAMDVTLDQIKAGLEEFHSGSSRMEILELDHGITVINDTYNANPGSVKAALLALKEMKGNRKGIAVLGDMLELGDQTADCHAAVGRYAAQLNTDYLLVMGEFASHTVNGAIQAGMPESSTFVAATHKEIADKLREITDGDSLILVKGSRRMRMEEVVRQLGGRI